MLRRLCGTHWDQTFCLYVVSVNGCLLFSILRSILGWSQTKNVPVPLGEAAEGSRGDFVQSRSPQRCFATWPSTRLISDPYVDRIIYIPPQGLSQQRQWAVHTCCPPLKNMWCVLSHADTGCLLSSIWSGQSEVEGAELVVESSGSSRLHTSQIVLSHHLWASRLVFGVRKAM